MGRRRNAFSFRLQLECTRYVADEVTGWQDEFTWSGWPDVAAARGTGTVFIDGQGDLGTCASRPPYITDSGTRNGVDSQTEWTIIRENCGCRNANVTE